MKQKQMPNFYMINDKICMIIEIYQYYDYFYIKILFIL